VQRWPESQASLEVAFPFFVLGLGKHKAENGSLPGLSLKSSFKLLARSG